MEKRFAYGKTTWGEFLMGRKLIPSWLLEDVVNGLVREPRARQWQLRRGGELLRAAEKAALEKTAALEEEKPASGSETQLLIRLDEARKGQLQAQETLLSTTQIIYTLLAVVASLRERCAVLEKERDRVAERLPATVAEVQQQLVESERRLADTESRLERARREREEAEELRIEAQLIAQKHRRALEQFQQRSRRRPAEEDSDGQVPGQSSSSAVNELPKLWEFDQVLAAADQQLDAHDAQITALRRHMGLTPSRSDEQADRVVVGEVVRNQAADNPDSTAASTDVDHSVSADNADTANAIVAGRRTAVGHPALPAPDALEAGKSTAANRKLLSPATRPIRTLVRAWSDGRPVSRAAAAVIATAGVAGALLFSSDSPRIPPTHGPRTATATSSPTPHHPTPSPSAAPHTGQPSPSTTPSNSTPPDNGGHKNSATSTGGGTGDPGASGGTSSGSTSGLLGGLDGGKSSGSTTGGGTSNGSTSGGGTSSGSISGLFAGPDGGKNSNSSSNSSGGSSTGIFGGAD
ncbi:hypothetical protein [Streptomyces sp. GS7]|uniref:hypothetical protein n=1 Tax=Streptomyces sp. GS7 TaxID=2692234 RepID=UPI0013161087|nr:hypothetical protein [Streptomyces sp. GS7]QHC23329.1 hypothetical protein GR130_19955 [Streptomyces sp. GS7]